MIRFAKTILSVAGVLLAGSALAATPVTKPVNLPLYFEANQGQADVSAQFIARGPDYQFLIAPAEARMILCQSGMTPAAVRLQFVGASTAAQLHGDAGLPGKVNYLTGNNPAQWHTGVPLFARVGVEALYPGINLVYYGNQQQLEYDFTVAPGANAGAIALHFEGVDKIAVNLRGELVLILPGGEIHQPKPLIYQTLNGARQEIAGGYRLVDAHTAAFAIGEYDHTRPLVIDPVLEYSTYFGGNGADSAYAVALDANGNVYIAGQTLSKQISTSQAFATTGAFQTNYAGGNLTGDAFVFKLNAASGNPDYITYLGGSANDGALGITVDATGNAYVTGFTDSPNFPTTNALYRTISGTFDPNFKAYPVDAFVAELDPSGSHLAYSTYLGGSGMDSSKGIAVDAQGNTYVTGFTYSTNFPTVNALQKNLACTNSFFFNANAFIAEIGPGGTNLVYSTYFGGNNFDTANGVAVDTNGFVYVTGFTASTNFPAINAFQQSLNQSTNLASRSFDAFVAKLNPAGAGLVYSTYLGSTNNDVANGIAVDGTGAAYVTGWTVSSNFPNTFGSTVPGLTSFLATNTSITFLVTNAFLTKITNGAQAGIAWSALFGGKGVDVGNAVALDPAGDIFVAGSASSANFPTFNVPSLMRYTNSGQSDAFIFAISAATTNLLYSTYLGGQKNDYGYGIAVFTNGDAYVVGQTLSKNFLTLNPDFPNLIGPSDAFLAKIMLTVDPPVITTQPESQTNAVGSSISLNVYGTGTSPFLFQWQKDLVNLTDGTHISGATNSNVLTIDNAQATNSGQYWLIITNYGGAVTSSYAILLITNVPPTISTNNQPISRTNGVGTTATFSVFATGTAPLSYHWQLDGINLTNRGHYSGVTNTVLTISNVQLTNAGNYSVVVTNSAGIAISSNALLTVLSSPEIVVQPNGLTNAVGSTVGFAATAIGTVPLRYQWWDGTNALKNGSVKNGPTITGATTNVLIISNAQMTNSGNYTLVVSNISGSVTSSNASLSVTNIPPGITPPQPAAFQTNGVGTTVTLAITVTGTAPLHYQWQLNGMNLVNGGQISGVNTNVLKITNVQLTNSGNYMLGVTNNYGNSTNSSVFNLTVESSPVILVQPISRTNAVGSNVSFTVTAVGTAPLSYQWWNGTNKLVNGGQISGATSTNLTINKLQTNNASTNYTVVVTNISGSMTSSNTILAVTNIPPTITLPPTNQTIAAGSTATLVVTATGPAPLSYQWQFDGTNLVNGLTNGVTTTGATTNALIISNAQTNNSGNYTVIITNLGGAVTSSPNAVLTVTNIPLAISLQPTNQAIPTGSNVTFVVNATGTAPLSYQWQENGANLVNGGNISGATTNVLKISNVQTNDASTNYSVIVSNWGGSVTSSVVSLTVLGAPVITLQPAASQSIAVGSNVNFTVTAIGIAPLSYHWRLNGTNLVNGGQISGVTTTNLVISNAQTTNSGTYTVVVTNLAGSITSSNAVLLVTNIPPTITVQPISQTNGVGSTAILAVTATGTAPLSYHWQLEGTNLVNGGHYSGVTTNVLTVSTVQLTNAGNYTVIITNFGGSATSSIAVLTVQAAPIIVTQPATNQSMAVGSTATFSVTAVGTVPLSYQWWNGTNQVKNGSFNGADISGATTSQLFISNAQTNNSSTNYTVTVTNISGSVTSLLASLTVTNIPPSITLQPTNQASPAGSNIFMVVTATGTAPLSYQWQLNGTNLINGGQISGATTTTLKISHAQTNNSDTSYSVIITNYGGSITSSTVSLTVAAAPMILMLQPTNQMVAAGSTPSFAVTAVGILPLSYQWQLNGTNLGDGSASGFVIHGATTANLTLGNVQTNNSSTNITVTVTNTSGSVISSFLSLTVTNVPPTITLQPTNQAVGVGSTVTLAVTVTGTLPFTYQWQVNQANLVNGGQISGATNATLTISNAQTTNSGTYTLIIAGPGGSTTSSNAVLTVTNVAPTITVQPTTRTVGAGSTVALKVTATGTAPLSYQWLLEGTNLVDGSQNSGSTTNVLTISNVQTNNTGNYSVIVTNLVGSTTSSNALLTVTNAPPTITVQPISQTNEVGTTVTLAVTAIGTDPLSYQWLIGGTNLVDGGQINGVISNRLTISNAQLTNSGTYTVVVTNIIGSVTSSNALLMVSNAPPTITLQPTNQTVGVGSTVTLVVAATGTAPLSYQWLLAGTNLVDGGQINGAISNILTISNAQLINSGTYTVVVTNIIGSVVSTNAVLTVVVAPLGFGGIDSSGFKLSGTGGTSNGTYYVLVSSNLLAPLTDWTSIATDQFDSAGNFIFTNTTQTNTPQLFYILQLP